MNILRPPGPIKRLFPRGLIGGAAGLIAGGAFGWVQWHLAGLAGLGAGTLIVVAPIVDRFTAKRRRLSAADIDYARAIYADSVDYGKVQVTRDSVFAIGAPRTIMNTIHLKSGWGHFVGDSQDLSDQGKETFIHELCHAWQYQAGGLAYIPKSIWAQLKAVITKHTRDAAYDWRSVATAAPPVQWEKWNPEQQAESMQDYSRALHKPAGPPGTPADPDLALVLPYVQKVREKEGAPTFGRPTGKRVV
jgi:hypothetical protein